VSLCVQVVPDLPLPLIKVADFGLSKHDASLTFTRVVRHLLTRSRAKPYRVTGDRLYLQPVIRKLVSIPVTSATYPPSLLPQWDNHARTWALSLFCRTHHRNSIFVVALEEQGGGSQ
jgi:hypothetical protein